MHTELSLINFAYDPHDFIVGMISSLFDQRKNKRCQVRIDIKLLYYQLF